MKTRHLNTLQVSAIGLGCMGMSKFYGASDEQQSIDVLHHALASGVTLFDTADIYGYGANEILVGKALKSRVLMPGYTNSGIQLLSNITDKAER
jgi:aryl-alcohol dehydrogenase-like predicted oxidoreductase